MQLLFMIFLVGPIIQVFCVCLLLLRILWAPSWARRAPCARLWLWTLCVDLFVHLMFMIFLARLILLVFFVHLLFMILLVWPIIQLFCGRQLLLRILSALC